MPVEDKQSSLCPETARLMQSEVQLRCWQIASESILTKLRKNKKCVAVWRFGHCAVSSGGGSPHAQCCLPHGIQLQAVLQSRLLVFMSQGSQKNETE